MLKEQARLLNRLTVVADLSVFIISFVAAYEFRKYFFSGDVSQILDYMWVLFPAIPVWYYLLLKYKLYKSIRQISYLDLVYRILSVHFFTGIILSAQTGMWQTSGRNKISDFDENSNLTCSTSIIGAFGWRSKFCENFWGGVQGRR